MAGASSDDGRASGSCFIFRSTGRAVRHGGRKTCKLSYVSNFSAIIGFLSLIVALAFTGAAIFSPLFFYLFQTTKDKEGIEALRKDAKRGWKLAKFGNPVALIPFVAFVSISYLWRNRSYIVGR